MWTYGSLLQVDLYTGAIFIQQSLGWDIYLSIIVLVSVVAVMTVTGSQSVHMYTLNVCLNL